MSNGNQYPTINMQQTGNNIKQLIKGNNLTVADVAHYMGFAEPQAVYKWLRGASLPTVDNLFALSKLLNTRMEDILIGDDGMSSPFLLTTIS